MDTQNTPVHIRLWHRRFWFMAFAGLLLSSAMYMLIPVMPAALTAGRGLSATEVAVVMSLQGVGVFAFGGFVSYFVQRYRRNKVCLRAVFMLMLTFVALYYLQRVESSTLLFGLLCLVRIAQGAFYGLARMVLGSTLVIDTCESFRRTEANHAIGWFTRFGLAIGPALGLVLMPFGSFDLIIAVSAGMCIAAYLLVSAVKFPFKAPDDTMRRLSLDRFWLSGGWCLSLNLIIVSIAVGMILACVPELRFFSMMTCGFLLSLLAQRYLFVQAELKSEIISGIMLIATALLILMTGRHGTEINIAGTLFGCGTGLAGARFLLCFIKMSDHCQRGTAQSTFFLSTEFGVSAGVMWGMMWRSAAPLLFPQALAVSVVALIMYAAFTHSWYMKNKHR